MKAAVIVVVVAGAVFGIDRAALWAETRGWIYWRRRKRVGFHAGAAIAGELGAVLSPAERVRQEAAARAEQLPAPDDPGAAPPA